MTEPQACANCGEPLADLPRPPRFCPACGQETRVRAPTLMEFAQQFGGAYFSTEGALWRTLKLLVLKPGELTAQYLAGRRKHYVLPLRLYLTVSVLVLLLVRIAGGTGMVQVKLGTRADGAAPAAAAPFTPERLNLEMFGGRAGLRQGVFYCERLPEWTCRRLKSRLAVSPDELQQQVDGLKDRFLANLGPAMFVLLPSFALWLKLAYWNRRMRYTEHLVFALHAHAFWFLALATGLTDQPWISGPMLLVMPFHTMRAMRRVYGGRFWPRLLRAGSIALLYTVTLAFGSAGLAIYALLA